MDRRIALLFAGLVLASACDETTACPEGFEQSAGACADIDECLAVTTCGNHRSCTNTEGSYSCGACDAGYAADSSQQCVDVDECVEDPCGLGKSCTNSVGSYSCGACLAGFVDAGGGACADVDECAANHGGCDPVAPCDNTVGSFSCGACPSGYDTGAGGDCLRNDPSLSGITLASPAFLVPAFDPAVTSYELYYPEGSTTAVATVQDPAGVTITRNGVVQTGDVTLIDPTTIDAAGAFTVTIVVTTETSVSRTYTFRIQATDAPLLEARAPSPAANAGYGAVLDADATMLVVGAPDDDRGGAGVNPSPTAPAKSNSGTVYVYVRSTPTSDDWTLEAVLKASNADASDRFGASVDIADSTTGAIVVGAPNEDGAVVGPEASPDALNGLVDAGAVYVFERVGGVWTQTRYLKATNPGEYDGFGSSLGASSYVSGGNVRVLIGAPYEDTAAGGVGATPDEAALNAGAAYSYVRTSSGVWGTYFIKSTAPSVHENFGASVAEIGSAAFVVGAPGESLVGFETGAAYLFFDSNGPGLYTQIATLRSPTPDAGDRFGASLSAELSGTFGNIYVGAPNEDSAATGVGGSSSDDSAADSGAVFYFAYVGLDAFSTAATANGTAYLKAYNSRAGDRFGASIDCDSIACVIGAPGQSGGLAAASVAAPTDASAVGAGAAYHGYLTSDAPGFGWMQLSFMKALQPRAGDAFGSAVAVSRPSSSPIFVGAPLADQATAGLVSPGQASGTFTSAGAVFFFQ